MRRAERDCSTESRRQQKPPLLLPGRDAGCVGLRFYAGFDFQGLWLGLLAVQASCVVTMLVVLNRTDWELEAQRAKQLTSGSLVTDEEDDDPLIKLENSDAPHSLV